MQKATVICNFVNSIGAEGSFTTCDACDSRIFVCYSTIAALPKGTTPMFLCVKCGDPFVTKKSVKGAIKRMTDEQKREMYMHLKRTGKI